MMLERLMTRASVVVLLARMCYENDLQSLNDPLSNLIIAVAVCDSSFCRYLLFSLGRALLVACRLAVGPKGPDQSSGFANPSKERCIPAEGNMWL